MGITLRQCRMGTNLERHWEGAHSWEERALLKVKQVLSCSRVGL